MYTYPVTIQNMYTYHCHNTKHVHVPLSQHKTCIRILSQYKTCTRTTVTTQNMYTYPVTIQNMYTYHCNNTKHVHVPLSQYNTKHVHVPLSQYNTKHVHVPLSQFKTCTRTTATIQNMYTYPVTIQNMYTYHCHNTKHVHVSCHSSKHVHVPLSQFKTCACTTRYCKYYCLLSGYWFPKCFAVETSDFAAATLLIQHN